MRTITSAEARNHFGMLLDTAQREPVSITRRGRTVAYLFSPQEFEALKQSKNGIDTLTSTTQALAAFRGSGNGGSATRLVESRSGIAVGCDAGS